MDSVTGPQNSPMLLKQFYLERIEDETGVSGTGIVAYGVILPSGTAVLEWVTPLSSIAIYRSIQTLQNIHSHEDKTLIRYLEIGPDTFGERSV